MEMIQSLIRRVQTAQESMGRWTREALQSDVDGIMRMQYEQLAEGKASSGQDLRPYYSEDKYFKNKGRWYNNPEGYRNWKRSIVPAVMPLRPRNPDAPNLYINGKFWNELAVTFSDEAMTVDGGTDYARGIVDKYGLASFGLNAYNQGFLADNLLKPYLLRKLRETLL